MYAWLPAPIRSDRHDEGGSVPAFRVEALDSARVTAHRAAWADLARRALDPDIFHDPLFILPAAERFPPASRPTFLLVWASGERGQPWLAGLCAVRPPRFVPGISVARAWLHEQAVMAAPLLDATCAADALAALLAWLARAGCAGLLCRGVPLDGALGRALTALPHAIVGTRPRAVLTRAAAIGGRAAKDWRRQARRLADRGAVAVRSARGVEDVPAALDGFFLLETAGWKGRHGTSLGQDPALARFTRRMAGNLASEDRCRIYSLELDGRPVAMGIVLRSRDRAYFWKTAFDEALAALSPGRQFTQALTAAQQLDPDVAVTDSCALPDHPMIDRLWPERMVVADILVGPPGSPQRALDSAVGLLRAWSGCRGALKAGRRTALARLRRLTARLRGG